MKRSDRIASWLQERAAKAGARGFVFGLSGGIDSAVVARLCQMAAPQRVLGVLLPCYSDSQDEIDARLVASAFTIPVARVDLSGAFDALTGVLNQAIKGLPTHVDVLDIKQQMPEANI
jgi:NAD+ synthase